MYIEVIFALPNEQNIIKIEVKKNTTIKEAIKISKILDIYPQIDLVKNMVGIFGKLAKLDDMLRDKDRVEIYRSLIADPKEVRKRKALERKKQLIISKENV